MNQPSAEELSKTLRSEENNANQYICTVCGYRYPRKGIPFEALPDEWLCPICRTKKSEFHLL